MRSAATHAPLRHAVLHGSDHLGMVGQPEVVVGTEIQQALAIDHHLGALGAGKQRALAIQMLRAAGGEAGLKIEGHVRLP